MKMMALHCANHDTYSKRMRRHPGTQRKKTTGIVSFLRQREVLGSGFKACKPFARVPDRLRCDFKSLQCGSQVVLGFSSSGNEVLGYSTFESQATVFSGLNASDPRVRIQGWMLDISERNASRRTFTVELPGLLKTSDALEEFLVPMSIVHTSDRLMVVTRCVQRSESFKDLEAFICILDELDPRFGSILKVGFAVEERVQLNLLSTVHHVRCDHDVFSVAFDMGNQIRIVYIGRKTFPSTPSARWWRRRDQDCDLSPADCAFHLSGSTRDDERSDDTVHAIMCQGSSCCYYTCRTLDAEGFLVETLQRQLDAKLVLARSFETVVKGTFILLDYAIEFVRFISSTSFEFAVVSKVRMHDGVSYIGIVAQVSLTAHRIIHVMKSMSSDGTSRMRCGRLVNSRRRGYAPANIVRLTNEPVIAGKPVSLISNPELPFEIFWDPSETLADMDENH